MGDGTGGHGVATPPWSTSMLRASARPMKSAGFKARAVLVLLAFASLRALCTGCFCGGQGRVLGSGRLRQCSTDCRSAEGDHTAAVPALMSWLRRLGAFGLDDVRIGRSRDGPEAGLGVFAARHFCEGEVVLARHQPSLQVIVLTCVSAFAPLASQSGSHHGAHIH